MEGEPGDDAGRASLAALYCAWMTALSLRLIGDRAAIVVDGPFAQNTAYLGALAACLPDRCVSSSVTRTGTAAGAARLALLDGASAPDVPTAPVPVPRALAAQPGLMRWLEIMEAQAGTIG